MERLKKTAGILDVVCRIIYWVILVASGIFVLFTTIVMLNPEGISQYVTDSYLELCSIKLHIAEGVLPTVGKTGLIYLHPMLTVLIAAVLTGWGIRIIRSILKSMKAGMPFNGSVSVDLKKLGYLSFFGGLVCMVDKVIWDILFERLFFRISAVILQDTVTGITYSHTYDVTFVIMAVVFFLASYVFRWGEELQRQADETL